jgi:hypothetical protein
MRPLKEVLPTNLIPGKQYLIEYVGPTPVSNSKFKATFIENKLPDFKYQCILSKFKNIIYQQKLNDNMQFNLQNVYYKYYEADARIRFYTDKVLQNITGDPDFQTNCFDN